MESTCDNGPNQWPVRMTSRKPTDECSFSDKPERSALYELSSEKRVEIVAGHVGEAIESLVTINNSMRVATNR